MEGKFGEDECPTILQEKLGEGWLEARALGWEAIVVIQMWLHKGLS